MGLPAFLARAEGGLWLVVKVTPGSARERIGGVVSLGDGKGEALAVALAARAVDGKANKALVAFLAGALGCSKSAILLKQGMTGRVKRLWVAGDAAALAEKAQVLAARGP
jgi:uncharacterized protein YggU (UPF0235/DUF167 family)